MTWDLNDKFLALSLWHDHELSPEERAQVAGRLTTDAAWRETYEALCATERQLAASLKQHLQAAGVEVALTRMMTQHRLDETAFPAEVASRVFASVAEQRLAGVLGAHRLDEAGFPAEVASRVFASAADRWLTRVLTAHRLGEKFVQRVLDARLIEGFQEPLDAQLREALGGHRVGSGFVEKVLSGARSQPDGNSAAVATPLTDIPVVPIAAAAEQESARAQRRRTPTQLNTPVKAGSTRSSSARRAPLAMPQTAAPAKRPAAFLRWLPYAAAAAVLLVAVALVSIFTRVSPTGEQPRIVAQHLHVTVYTPTGTVAQASVAGLPGYVFAREMEPERRSFDSGAETGVLLVLSDAGSHQAVARVVLDAHTQVQWADSTVATPRGSLTLVQGGVLADVEKAGSTFTVLTGSSAVRDNDAITVHGTRFFVHADGRQSTVDVLEGLVSFVAGGRKNPGGEPLAVAPVSAVVMLPSGARYARDWATGSAQLQRADPSEIFYAFAPRGMSVSAWPQAGGGLERGGPALASVLSGMAAVATTEKFGGIITAPVVAADGRFVICRNAGVQTEMGTLTLTGADADAADGFFGRSYRALVRLTGRFVAGPVVLPRGPVALVIDHRLEAYSLEGALAWRVDLPAAVDVYALSGGPRGRAILSTSQGLKAYDGATGALVWENHEVGEMTSGVAATERADLPFLLAYDSIHARLHKLDADGALLKTLDFRATDAAPGAQALARDIKDWTLAATPILVGDNCVLVFEDGATALVNLTTGASRMTAGLGATERVRYASLDRATLWVTVLLQSGAAWQCDLNTTAAAAAPVSSLPSTDLTAIAVSGERVLTVTASGQLQRWSKR